MIVDPVMVSVPAVLLDPLMEAAYRAAVHSPYSGVISDLAAAHADLEFWLETQRVPFSASPEVTP